jgi:hypothetical protein
MERRFSVEAKTFFLSSKASQLRLEERKRFFRADSGGSERCVLVGYDDGRGVSVSGAGGLHQRLLVKVGSR